MTTLNSLKRALKQKAREQTSSPSRPLSDTQYSAGFEKFVQGSGWLIYQDFIIPQLSQLLLLLCNSRASISVLEIGPGPKTVLRHLPSHLRRKVARYVAIEPKDLYATSLEEQLCSLADGELPLPCLGSPPSIHRTAFVLGTDASMGVDEKFDVILFCHSMHGMDPNYKFIERALEMLYKRSKDEMVVIFHRDDTLHLGDLVCHRTASFPTGFVGVADDDDELDNFAPFAAGFVMEDASIHEAIRVEWRKVCRNLGRVDGSHPGQLLFSAPNVMVAFNQHATALSKLKAQVPVASEHETVKNREARLRHAAAIMKPTEVQHVQKCVQWALQHGVGLTVVGGGHSGHCLWPGVVAINMGAFDQVHIATCEEKGMSTSNSGPLVVAGSGCRTEDIVQTTTAAGLIVPLGARPSVGSGLWLQGGIGHLARLHGLSCDAIVGAVLVSVASSQVLYVGRVPSQHRPVGAVRPQNDVDLLCAIKGAGSNFGVVLSVTFRAYEVPTFSLRNWVVPLGDGQEAKLKLGDVSKIAGQLPQDCSIDAYLHWDSGQLRLGVTMFECTTGFISEGPVPPVSELLGPDGGSETADAIRLFDAEMYMSTMHGGHGGGKTSAFKRCVFLKDIGTANIADLLVKAVETRPSPLCYLHLLHGGGAVADIASNTSAFGCRDWAFACVVTGVWPRDLDGTKAAEAAKRWVYEVVTGLLPFSSGAYGADLGPDPRDAGLAVRAFGPNRKRLARLKRAWDPCNVLAYGCPLGVAPLGLIVLVTGESGAGKDHCARVWETAFTLSTPKLTARTVSISDETKREYAQHVGADLNRLLHDRAYKEQHRPALTAFWQDQVQRRPRLGEEHFLNVVRGGADVDVLLITGIRDEAPVAAFSHLVPESKLLEVRVTASEETRLFRGARCGDVSDHDKSPTALDYRPSLIFDNDGSDDEAVKSFAKRHLLPFVHEDLDRLASMVPLTPDFPRSGIQFRHVLNISQEPSGLALCMTLLRDRFLGDWANISRLVCCQSGGFIFASALGKEVEVPLALVRAAGKLPPPTISATKSPSHVSSPSCDGSTEERIEMQRNLIPKGSSVVVVDDVLATGQTLFAVLQLLGEAGIGVEDIAVLVVAEFPFHRGRELLHRRGFGGVSVQSLLIFGGA